MAAHQPEGDRPPPGALRHADPEARGEPVRARLEVAAVAATGALHVALHRHFVAWAVFVAAAVGLWLPYLARRARREPGLLDRWGLGARGFWLAFRLSSLVAVPASAAIVVAAGLIGHRLLTARLLLLLAVYPLWGVAQQFLLQALLAANLQILLRSRVATVGIAAALFGLLHAPDLALAGLTSALAFAFVPIYLKARNVYPLGFWHGFLGALAYFGLLGRDPLAVFVTAKVAGPG